MMDIPAFASPEAMWGIEDVLVFSSTLVSLALIFKSLENRRRAPHILAQGWYLFLAAAGVALSVLFLAALLGGWRVSMAAGKSMLPTLSQSTTLVVDSHSYGHRKPFLGWWGLPRLPQSGDVALFHARIEGQERMLAKRVVGLPGDKVEYRDGQLFVNSVRLSGDSTHPQSYTGGVRVDTAPARLSSSSFYVLSPRPGQSRLSFEGVVPEGHVFLVGDNWAESYDSRDFGPVPLKALRGRVRWAWSEQNGWVAL